MVELKYKDFIDAVQIMPSLWIVASGYREKGEPKFL